MVIVSTYYVKLLKSLAKDSYAAYTFIIMRMCVYIYIYIYRERERERERYVYVYVNLATNIL